MSKDKKLKFSFNNINLSTLVNIMSTPTIYLKEHLIKEKIIKFAADNNIECIEDNNGNLLLTKGELNENEYYPCVTSHLDTVQVNTDKLIEKNESLEIQTFFHKSNGKLYMQSKSPYYGIGADCKAGISICLSLFLKCDKLKAFFPICEELGCWGTFRFFNNEEDKKWFDNVGYVIGFDSPESNRAAWASNGVKLFDSKFFNEHLKDICSKNNVTAFRSEPYTDVFKIKECTNLACMNFGNGGHYAHDLDEYLVIDEADNATKLGIELIQELGLNQYIIENKVPYKEDKDTKFFNDLLIKEIKEGHVTFDEEKEGLGTNDLSTIFNKLMLKAKKLGIDSKEIEDCFNWKTSDGSEYF